MSDPDFSETLSDSKTDSEIEERWKQKQLGEITPDAAFLLINKWRDEAQSCADWMKLAMDAKAPPLRLEVERFAARRDTFQTCATELELCARIKFTNDSPRPEWIIQECHIQSDEWHNCPHVAPFFNRECAEEFCKNESACHYAYAYRVVPKSKSAVQKLLDAWGSDSAWHKKRAKDYAARCGGAPQWVAEAASEMLLQCLRELKQAVNDDGA